MNLSFIGQKAAVSQLTNYFDRCQETGTFQEILTGEGPAAVGKSRLFGEYAGKLASATGANLLKVESASEFSRSDSQSTTALVRAVQASAEGERTVFLIDESHNLPLRPFSQNQSPVQRLFNSLLYGAGQGWNRTGSLEFLGDEIPFNAGNLQFILLTNHPEKIGGGKNSIAILRRFYRIALTRYSDSEMRKVIPHFFQEKGREVEPKAATFLSRMHRGTMEAIAEFLKILPAYGKITLDMIQEFLPVCRFQARGFTQEEIKVLRWLATTTEPRSKDSVLLRFPEIDLPELFRHAARQTVKLAGEENLSECPFLFLNARKEYTVTEAGLKFLTRL